MKVLIAGGGTGGHVIPALAVAAELRRRGPAGILMVGTSRGMEAKLAPLHGVDLETVEVGALKRVGLARTLGTLAGLPLSFWRAGRILDRFRPDVVYGVGGYASGPVLLMAAARGLPIVVHEPNAQPGFANRIIAPAVTCALIAFPEAARFFPSTRVQLVGVPVRPDFCRVPAKRHAPPYTILVSGGSQGAKSINRAVVESLPLFAQMTPPPYFIHQTGPRDYEEVATAYSKLGVPGEVVAFINEMPAAFARADLLITRAGASTLAEITAAGKAAILVPFPFAADDHQLKNARSLEAAGAARVVQDNEVSGRVLFEMVQQLWPRLGEMEERSRALARPRALEEIVDTLERTALDVL